MNNNCYCLLLRVRLLVKMETLLKGLSNLSPFDTIIIPLFLIGVNT
jgi:hypothetical protein